MQDTKDTIGNNAVSPGRNEIPVHRKPVKENKTSTGAGVHLAVCCFAH
jgi:hypothetical protein